jgi:3-oxoacyl-[acyl-carrier-protein] synthase-3
MSDLKRVKIAGVGSYAPEKVLDNAYFEKIVDTTDEWIVERSGIRERRMLAEDECTSDTAAAAGKRAIEDAGLKPEDIDLIVVGTVTADTIFPACACYVSKKLGTGDVGAFDVSAGCSGFLYSLTTAVQFVKTGMNRNVLVIGAESLTRITDYTDRNTCVLFGDAAGAVILTESDDESEIISTHMYAREGEELLSQPAGGARHPATHATVDEHMHFIQMQGREVYKFAVPRFTELIRAEMEENNLTLDDIKLVVPHQVNIRIVQAFAKRLRFPIERIMLNLDKYGNTSAASIPLAFDDAVRAGIVKRGDYVIFAAVGAGLTWSSALVRY